MGKEGRIDRISEQITQIELKLQRGTEPIKQGHRVSGLNPDGNAVEIPFSPTKRKKLQWTDSSDASFQRAFMRISGQYDMKAL